MVRIFVRRFAWAMVGAAIGVAVVLVVYYVLRGVVVRPLIPVEGSPVLTALVAAGSLIAAFALGLVPGARELEVTAARTLLRAEGDLVVPASRTWGHRVRTSAWVVLHLLTGLVVGFCLFGLVPAAVVIGVEAAAGQSLGTQIPVPDGVGARTAVVVGCVIGAIAMAGAAWPAGALAERLVTRFLGPTAADRLQVALARQRREAEHTLLARELHDGIGHALTIVSVQAAAGRRVARTRPERAADALAAIEEVSRGALAELDALLGILRDDREPSPAGGVADVVEQHRRSGLEVRYDGGLRAGLPPLLRRSVVRIVTEGLTNARRHGGPGEVRLDVEHTDAEVIVRVTNALAAPTGPQGARSAPAVSGRAGTLAATASDRDGSVGGRGLSGIRERAALFGGTAEAGIDPGGDGGDRWVLTVRLPHVAGTVEESGAGAPGEPDASPRERDGGG